VDIATIEWVRKRFIFECFEASLKPQRSKRKYSRKLDGEQEAHVIALVCSLPSKGYACWSLCLLADQVVKLKITDAIWRKSIRQVLDNNKLEIWSKQKWCISAANAFDIEKLISTRLIDFTVGFRVFSGNCCDGSTHWLGKSHAVVTGINPI
jgi:hypothetical protein